MGKKGDETKSLIVAKAIELFRERGYDQVTIEDICRELNIVRGTFYYHFRTKDEVLFGFYEEPEAFTVEHVSAIFAADNYWEQLWLSYLPFLEYTQKAGAEVLSQCMRSNLNENRGTFDPRVASSAISVEIIKKCQAADQIRNKADPATLNFIAIQLLIAYDFRWAILKEGFEKISAMRGALEILFDVDLALRNGGNPITS